MIKDEELMRNFLKKALLVFVFSFCVGGMVVPIAASTAAQSNIFEFGPVNGYSYRDVSWITVGSSANASAAIACYDSDAPPGYMGIRAKLYRDDVLVATTSYKYNSSYDDYISKSSSYYSTHGDYHSGGTAKVYSGNGYYYYTVYLSPVLTLD